tara:strand:- start:24801 stop:25973 length:1173 start_codon:yes stop_codon:yes gene_type:complete
LTSSLGRGRDQHLQRLLNGQSGLAPCRFPGAENLNAFVGEVDGLDRVELPAALERFDCRNNRLAWLGLAQDSFRTAVEKAVARHGASRVAVFIGTSTSGIQQTELAYRALDMGKESPQLPDWYCYEGTHNASSVAEFVRLTLGLEGASSAVSTACSSSAKVFASAHRAIRAGLCDAAVVGGVDSLCLTTLHGFNALQLVAQDICRPFDAARQGLSIGEAAGFALLEQNSDDGLAPCLLGYGESSDAYHMSAPHPEGKGAYRAMSDALSRAALAPADIDYINLHGTGTRANDQVESLAVQRLFGSAVPCSSTKGFTGHTLGAAGIVEAVIALLCLQRGLRPASLNIRDIDPEINLALLLAAREQALDTVLSNSFGFGGSNCSLILGRAAHG